MEHPKTVGDRTTLAVMLACQARGMTVLVPFSENTRYDLAVDQGARLARVQCKTGRLRNGAIRFNVCSSYAHHRGRTEGRPRERNYADEIDYFGVYCAATGGVYLVPLEAVPNRREAAIRVEPARNGQRAGIRDASRYLVASLKLDVV